MLDSKSKDSPKHAISIDKLPLAQDFLTLGKAADDLGTPLLAVDHEALRKSCDRFKKCFPNFTVFYAIKVNFLKEILQTVYQQGLGYDFASIKEFHMLMDILKPLPEAEKVAFIQEKTIYAHPVKPPKTLMELDKYGILTTFDCLEEVHKIKKYAPHTRLILRLAVHNHASVYNLNTKFGCEQREAMDLIEAAIAEGLTVEGISFHIGSQSSSAEAFEGALKDSLWIFTEAAKKGIILKKIDIGGGFPVNYGEHVCTLEECSDLIMPLLAQFPKGTKFVAEPGRVIIGETCTLVTRVIGKTERKGMQCVYIDDGVYGILSCNLMDIKRPLYPFKTSGELKLTTIFGPTCDCQDKLIEDALLPEIKLGDLFYAPTIGAYSNISACPFNGMGNYSVYNHDLTLKP